MVQKMAGAYECRPFFIVIRVSKFLPMRMPFMHWTILAAGCCLAAVSSMVTAQSLPISLAVVATRDSSHLRGQDVVDGANDAVSKINARGGLLGRRISVDVHYDDCSTVTAERIARSIAALAPPHRPAAVIGHTCSGAAIAAAPIYAAANLAVIFPGPRHPRVTDQRPAHLIFRLAPREDRLADDLAGVIRMRFSGQRTALVHDRSAQSLRLADAIEAALARDGIRLALREAYTHGEKSYDGLVDRLRRSEASVVIAPAQPTEAGIIARRLSEHFPQARLIVGDALAVPGIEQLVTALGLRLWVMLPWMETPPPIATSTGTLPKMPVVPRAHSGIWIATHAAVEAWANAVTTAGTFETDAVVRGLETEQAPTIAGSVRFDTRGDAAMPSFVPWHWQDGRWQMVADR